VIFFFFCSVVGIHVYYSEQFELFWHLGIVGFEMIYVITSHFSLTFEV